MLSGNETRKNRPWILLQKVGSARLCGVISIAQLDNKPIQRTLRFGCAVTMLWKEHVPNPDNKPGPDFMAMNLASIKR